MNKNVLWITRSAVFTALLILIQAVTAPMGNTLLTGSMVNLILIVSVMLCGLGPGITVALLSPVFAKFIGIGPLWAIVPFIMAGNTTLVLVWHFIGNKGYVSYVAALALGASAKFLVLYIGVVQVAVPILLKLPDPQATVISGMFSIPQLLTAIIGGVIACAILPVLKMAVRRQS